MSRPEEDAPTPVLVIGPGANRVASRLGEALARSGLAGRLSCAGFESPETAAAALTGAEQLVLVAVGNEFEAIFDDSVWAPWRDSIAGARSNELQIDRIGRIALSDSAQPLSEGSTEAAASGDPTGIQFLAPEAAELLPTVTRLVASHLSETTRRQRLARELATQRACEPLSDCLEPGKIYTMALDLLLAELGRERGIALFSPSPAPQTPGVAARGFDVDMRDQISRQVIEEKAIEAAMGQGEVTVVPWGPLHHVLGRVGIDSPGPLLSVPLRGDESEAGHVWLLADGCRFAADDLTAAQTIARRASAALTTAERYHHAKERAFIDDVTGVYNARYLLATAENEIQRAARYGRPLSVLFLDLDRFKGVNDRYGHLIGSATLRTLSQLLGQCVRQVDTLARYGGDEFTILLVDTDHETAERIAERIRARVEEHRFEAGREGHHQLTISIGVATCPDHADGREALLDAADKAMYLAKSRGRNRVCSGNDLQEDNGDAPSVS